MLLQSTHTHSYDILYHIRNPNCKIVFTHQGFINTKRQGKQAKKRNNIAFLYSRTSVFEAPKIAYICIVRPQDGQTFWF